LDATQGLNTSDAVLIARFGDLGLLRGGWPIIGRQADWNPEEWSVPLFGKVDHVDKTRAWCVEYSDPTLEWVRDIPATPQRVAHLPEDGVDGYLAIEIVLTRLLAK
jgi:hypothetical protein